jgi:hypothetical protein
MAASPENAREVEVNILWSGGSATYLIDPSQKQEMSQEEKEKQELGKKAGRGIYPLVYIDGRPWLKCIFLISIWDKNPDTSDDGKIVRIISKLSSSTD